VAKNFVKLRFRKLSEEEATKLQEYGYQINIKKASGEYAVHCLLDVGAWARKPLGERFHSLKTPTSLLCEPLFFYSFFPLPFFATCF